jgi:putative hydrolase of the HAD superfamily
MIIIFDLDDTLYDERTYVESGILSVASFGADKFGWDVTTSYKFMTDILDREGRGSIFDRWLIENGRIQNKGLIRECVKIYRYHIPTLQLCQEARSLLPTLSAYPLYIVTDGHKIVQQKKVESLNLKSTFRHIFITHRYGVQNAKPSTYCFAKIRERENCKWNEMMYIGDNPAKDFVNLKPLGVHTVRVLTGVHKGTKAKSGYDAHQSIENLNELRTIVSKMKK